jgi:cell wall-associated NlpC family hydrolase
MELWHYAKTFLGTPYRYGGSDHYGMDCSGLVIRIYRDVYGIYLPHKTTALYVQGSWVSSAELQIGDLLFFQEREKTLPSHVGIYMGEGRFIHASTSKGVILSNMKNSYYRRRFVGARRIY